MQDLQTQLNPTLDNQDQADLVKLLQSASTQEQKDEAVLTWLKRFPGLTNWINKSYFPKGNLIDLIIAEYLSAERCQLFCQLFAGRSDEKEAGHLLQIFQKTRSCIDGFRHVPTAELKVFVELCNQCKNWWVERLVPRLKTVQQAEGFDFSAILLSPDHLAFFKHFIDNIMDHHLKNYFSDERLIEFFQLMQMPLQHLQRLWNLRETLSEHYYDFFVLTLIKDLEAADIQDLCSQENGQAISAAPYLMLFRDPNDTDVYLELLALLEAPEGRANADALLEDAKLKALLQRFIQSMVVHQLLMKDYATSPYTTAYFSRVVEQKYLTDFPWGDRDTINELFKRVRNGTNLCEATIKLIATTEGAVLPVLGPYLSTNNEQQFALLETLVFDYPELCTELQHCPTNDQYLQENFVTFAGYADIGSAKRVLQHPLLARLHLRNRGQQPCEHFNQLHREGIYEVLLAQNQNSENLQILTMVPHPDDHYFCPFFLTEVLVYAHHKEFLGGQTLLETMLTADITRFKLLVRCMSMLTPAYTAESNEENVHLAFIKMSNDLIDSGLMECIFNLTPPAIIPRNPEIDMAHLIERLMENLLQALSPYGDKLQLVALKMILKGMDAGSPYFINIAEHEGALDGFLLFMATQFNLYIDTIKKTFADTGKLSQCKEDRVLKFLLDKPELTQRCFERQLQEALKEFAVDQIPTTKHTLL
jgi:hypothetical protein